MKKTWLIIVILLLIIFLGWLFFFHPAEQRQAAESNSALSPIRLAFPNKIQYAPFIIGAGQGYFAKSGLTVTSVTGVGGIDAAEALLSGHADMGAMGDVPAIILLCRSSHFIILGSYMSSPRMHRLVAAADSGIRSVDDLPGKKLAVHFGSSTHGALLAYLGYHGIDPQAITLVPLSPVNFPEATQRREVDAIAGSEPWPQNVLSRCPGSYVVGVLRVPGNQFPHLLIVNRDYFTNNRQKVRKFVMEVRALEQDIRQAPETAAGQVAAITGRSVEQEAQAIGVLDWQLRTDASIAASLTKTAIFLKTQGKIRQVPNFSELFADHVVSENLDRPAKEQAE
jgi:ABC-type nitrate/sulfonate/bicarbonate transport system substrate-binding protein